MALRWKPVKIQKSKVTLLVLGRQIQLAQKFRYVPFKQQNNMSSNNIHTGMDRVLESPALVSSQLAVAEY